MTYELAKRLKDAGFPQMEDGYGYWYTKDSKVTYLGEKIDIPDKCYIPTLSELIEACEEGFVYLERITDDMWEVKGENNNLDDVYLQKPCKTPEEAVANLWLELNKSNKK